MTQQDIVINVDNVTKVFRMSQQGGFSLRREGLSVFKKRVPDELHNDDGLPPGFVALKDVSFQVQRGEALGIIGQNGAGKSTLLRIMAHILRPTRGHVNVDGRFTALISLGVGFIPDLSGYENIYLNAALFGVPPQETAQFIDEIIEFADIGDFIKQPIMRYSSGMRVRLGFSIAVHILPDIVFLDEVLAVGDLAFKRKCYAKVNDLLSENRTLVLVSHAFSDIEKYCQRVIWIDNGQVQMDGPTREVIGAFVKRFS